MESESEWDWSELEADEENETLPRCLRFLFLRLSRSLNNKKWISHGKIAMGMGGVYFIFATAATTATATI